LTSKLARYFVSQQIKTISASWLLLHFISGFEEADAINNFKIHVHTAAAAAAAEAGACTTLRFFSAAWLSGPES
jgi:hypothetical protein